MTMMMTLTGKHSRHHLITFPKGEPLLIRGREFSRNEIARAVGCDIGHISKIFAGQRTPSLFMARKISLYVGLAIDELYDLLSRLDVGQFIPPEGRVKRKATFEPLR